MAQHSNLRPVKAKSGWELGIHLIHTPVTGPDQPVSFYPGDTVMGFISRRKHIVAPHATVSIALIGRSVVFDAASSQSFGTTPVRFGSEFVLFKQIQPEPVFEGPLHIPANASLPETWLFSLTIPTKPSLSTSNIQQKPQGQFFLSLDAETISTTALPGSFHSGHHEVDSWVEYYLEATLTAQREGTRLFGGKNLPEIKHARLPIQLSTVPPTSPRLQRICYRLPAYSIRSHRLLPGLSPGQRLSRFLHRRPVPCYTFLVDLELPSVLQFGKSFPLQIRLVPHPCMMTHDIAHVVQTVRLVKLRLRITSRADTKIEYDSEVGGPYYPADEKVYLEVDFTKRGERRAVGDIIIPSTPPRPPFLNLGHRMQLQLARDHMPRLGGDRDRRWTKKLAPDFCL